MLEAAMWGAAISSSPQLEEKDFSRQAAELMSRTRISQGRLLDVSRVKQDLELVLNLRWPGSRLVVTGSIASGLATTESDVDLTLMLPQHADCSGAVATETKRLLEQYPLLFADCSTLPWAGVHVVSFTHASTQFSVDISFNNVNAVQVIKFVKYIFRLDERIYHLTFIVKHWATQRCVTGDHWLPSYGMILLITFYLQQVKMLPSIASIQDPIPFFANAWDDGFNEIEFITQNDTPLNLLLGGFFEYYRDFNYEKYIICPYLGYPVEREIFEDVNKVPDEFGLYVYKVKADISQPLLLNQPCVVQDAFIHNDNVAKYLELGPNSTFTQEFQRAAKAFDENNITFLDKILF